MPVKQVELDHFSAFKKLNLTFCSGINIFIGENGTGKSHLMKLMYSMVKALEDARFDVPDAPRIAMARLQEKLVAVFKPDDGQLDHLICRSIARRSEIAKAKLTWGNGDDRVVGFSISRLNKMKIGPVQMSVVPTPPSIFLPSREDLAMYEGFMSAYKNRELSFDETYYDLCIALSGSPLRGPRMKEAQALVAPLEKAIGGKVIEKGGRFYVQSKAAMGSIEAHLLAEGFRKLASIVRLIVNGSLMKNSILFWDEPEANLNPRLIIIVARVLRLLAAEGVQIFIASHDYLLTNELAMASNYEVKPKVPMMFFGFNRTDDGSAVEVESSDRLADLQDNPILREFAAHYDREENLIFPPSAGGRHNG